MIEPMKIMILNLIGAFCKTLLLLKMTWKYITKFANIIKFCELDIVTQIDEYSCYGFIGRDEIITINELKLIE